MAEADKAMQEFLAQFPEGHPDMNKEDMYLQLKERFLNSAFVEEWIDRIVNAQKHKLRIEVIRSLDEIIQAAFEAGDLGALISALDIFKRKEMKPFIHHHPYPDAQQDMILASMLVRLDRGDLAECFVPGISDIEPMVDVSPKERN